MAYLEQSTRYVPYTDKLHGRWRYHVPGGDRQGALRDRYVRTMDAAFETLREVDRRRCRSTSRARYPQSAAGLRRRAPRRDPRQGARHAARHAAGGDAVERRHLRHRPGVRGAAAPHARAPARRRCAPAPTQMLAELRKVIPAFLDARRPAGSRRPLERVPRRHARRDRGARARRSSTDVDAEPRDEVTLTDFDPDGEIKIVAAALYAVIGPARRSAAGDRAAHDRRTSAPRCCAPTSASARNRRHRPGPRLRAHGVPLRRPHRLRRVPRSAAPPAADARVAAAHARGTATPSPRRSREAGARDDWTRVMDASAELHEALRSRRTRRRRALRRRDGLPRPVLHGDERARGDARHRAAHRAAGPSRLPPRLPADAPADRRARRPHARSPPRCSSPITPKWSWSGWRPSASSNEEQTTAARDLRYDSRP